MLDEIEKAPLAGGAISEMSSAGCLDNSEIKPPRQNTQIEPRRTIVEEYLENRGLELPRESAFEAIRFHADCPFGPGKHFPVMICLVRNIVTNEPQGVHRTALAPDEPQSKAKV